MNFFKTQPILNFFKKGHILGRRQFLNLKSIIFGTALLIFVGLGGITSEACFFMRDIQPLLYNTSRQKPARLRTPPSDDVFGSFPLKVGTLKLFYLQQP